MKRSLHEPFTYGFQEKLYYSLPDQKEKISLPLQKNIWILRRKRFIWKRGRNFMKRKGNLRQMPLQKLASIFLASLIVVRFFTGRQKKPRTGWTIQFQAAGRIMPKGRKNRRMCF